MASCRYCGGEITFRYINGRRVPVHLSGGCRGGGRGVQQSTIAILVADAGRLVRAFMDLRRAQDDASKLELLQQRKSIGTVTMAAGVLVIALTIMGLHIHEYDRIGFFKSMWSSFVAALASCTALALWETLEHLWQRKYANFLQARGLRLSWLKLFLPYMLFITLVVGGITIYKLNY